MKNIKFFFFIILFLILIFNNLYKKVYIYGSEINKETNFYSADNGYIYRVVDNNINIVKINNYDDMSFESNIIEENLLIRNIYAHKNKLFVGGIKNKDKKSNLNIIIYDTEDKKNISKISEFYLDGEYNSFKVKDGIVFILSEDKNKIGIVSIDLNKNKINPTTQEFNGNNVNFMYMSEDDIYIVCDEDTKENKFTTIYKFDINEDILTYVDKINIEGSILNEKFMNEYKDELRIVSIDGNKNHIYIFNEDLKLINNKECKFDNVNNVYFDENVCYVSGYLKGGYIVSYNLNPSSLEEMCRLDLTSSLNYLYKINNDIILVIGNENRSDTYKNLQTDKVYEIIKNVGIKMMLIDSKNKDNLKIYDDYLIKGKQVYSPSFMDENRLLYLKDRNILVFPLDISNYNNDVDIYSAMEVSNNMYDSFILNYEEVFNGIYIFNVNAENGIDLKVRIDNKKEYEMFDCKDIESINIYDNKLFIFSYNSLKIFTFQGEFLGEYIFNT